MMSLSGGPGSQKGSLVEEIMYLYPGWACISVGALLRQHVQAAKDEDYPYNDLPKEKLDMIEDLMVKGELINQVWKINILKLNQNVRFFPQFRLNKKGELV